MTELQQGENPAMADPPRTGPRVDASNAGGVRNKKLISSHLRMIDRYTCEHRTVLWVGEECEDGKDVEVWNQGGSIEPREPTVAEVEAWLRAALSATHPAEDRQPAQELQEALWHVIAGWSGHDEGCPCVETDADNDKCDCGYGPAMTAAHDLSRAGSVSPRTPEPSEELLEVVQGFRNAIAAALVELHAADADDVTSDKHIAKAELLLRETLGSAT